MKIAVSILLLVFLANPVAAFVHASGQQILDAGGEPALMRGMGLGGWLVPEGYMLNTISQSPSTIRADIVDVVGETGADQFYTAYHNNYVTREDIHELAEWGFDHVRMPFHYNMFSPARGVYIDWGFEVTDSLIAWCSEVGMHVVLDMHCAPGGQNGGPISDSDGTARLWLEESNKAHTVEIWTKIAERYVDEPWVGGYDLLNEPVLPSGVTSIEFRALYVRLKEAIRAVDTNHMLFIEGNWYATDFAGLTPPFDTNMAYSFHKYWSVNDQNSIQSYLNMRNQYNVPLWMSETGENSNTWFYEAVLLFEENDIGWCWWTTKKFETITSPYSADQPAGWDLLRDYWSGSGGKPSPQAAQAILMEMADNLKTENCRFSPGVVASWFSPDYASVNQPFKEHKIPGTILAADYDIGAQGVAYLDDVYETVHWDNYTAWNNGHQYRNDGVDLQIEDSGIPNVGWATDGEWMKYTFHAEYGGIYDLSMEFASTAYSGQFRLYLDNQPLTTIMETPITGSWTAYESLLVEGLEIPIGDHELKLQILQSGPNIRTMAFIIDSVHTYPDIPVVFTLGQNYPNPFNGGTVIPLEIETDDPLTVEIFDILGRRVQFFDFTGAKGRVKVSWNGTDLRGLRVPAGTYYYQVISGDMRAAKKMLFLP
ncbi:MAG: cellulase family glycosylhydrolase [Candidatus Marinimicrobia bacterium]|nr:cellulase family glycosylhydrolase [Candidatus Neomarinimicrobiota bacterium]MCF7850405.1 cellulase family glycosylhydrolase [Candidatus Neomarinimicrobiota bacterium]MCF7904546.1 cellulase family glycosylhydrolase [Candidatus Neomarinimicrobiota bacterium]